MRKFFGWVGVLVGSFIMIVIGLGLYLMIAPGTNLFGIKYIKATDGTDVNVTKTYSEEVTGGIVIDTHNVPVVVEYVPYTVFEFTFVQKYNGYTRTKIDKPNLSVDLNQETGDLVVKTSEFLPFLWGTNSNGYSLHCKIPATFGTPSDPRSLTVTSVNSKVTITTDKDAASNIDNLVVQTKGAIKFSGNQNISNITIASTTKKIVIPATITTKNIFINCKNKSVTVGGEVTEKLTFKSNKGSLKFKNCGQLEVSSKGGSITSTETQVSVAGNASISTGGRGKVVLQKVAGDLKVKTSEGGVFVGQNKDSAIAGVGGKVDIKTKSGKIVLLGDFDSSEYANLSTTKGNIVVGDNSRSESEKLNGALARIKNLNIKTTSGSVSVELATNIKVSSKGGNVKIGKFTNTATITTTGGDVNVVGNLLGGTLNVKTGKNGHVKATNLGGETTISSGGSVYAQFASVVAKIDIAGSKKNVTVVVPDTVTNHTNHIWVQSKKTSANIKLFGLEKNGKIYHSVDTIPDGEQNKVLKITSTSGKIKLVAKSFE